MTAFQSRHVAHSRFPRVEGTVPTPASHPHLFAAHLRPTASAGIGATSRSDWIAVSEQTHPELCAVYPEVRQSALDSGGSVRMAPSAVEDLTAGIPARQQAFAADAASGLLAMRRGKQPTEAQAAAIRATDTQANRDAITKNWSAASRERLAGPAQTTATQEQIDAYFAASRAARTFRARGY